MIHEKTILKKIKNDKKTYFGKEEIIKKNNIFIRYIKNLSCLIFVDNTTRMTHCVYFHLFKSPLDLPTHTPFLS